MKINQKPMFQPITITLETAEEAEALWDVVRLASGNMTNVEATPKHKKLLADMSSFFSNNAQLGGE